MRKTRVFGVFAVLGGVFLSGPLRADLASDAQETGKWFSREVGELMAFQSAATHFLPGDTVKFPGVEVGLAGGAAFSTLDVDGYRAMNLTVLDNRSNQVSLPKAIGAPGGVLHAKVGLPGGWDLGLKAGGGSFDNTSGDAATEFDNKIGGIEVRKRLLGGGLAGAALPDLSVSLSFDSASGDVTRTERYNGAVTGGTMDANTAWRTDWDVKATSLRAVVSKKILIITPFAGLGVTKLSGKADTAVDINVVSTTAPGVASVNVKGSEDVSGTVGHVIAGFELAPVPFAKINLSGLVGREKLALSLGLRVQFP